MFLFASKPDENGEKTLVDILNNPKFDLGYILKWFKENPLKPNSGKFHFKVSGTNTDIKVKLFLDGDKIEKSQVVLLGRALGDKLKL